MIVGRGSPLGENDLERKEPRQVQRAKQNVAEDVEIFFFFNEIECKKGRTRMMQPP